MNYTNRQKKIYINAPQKRCPWGTKKGKIRTSKEQRKKKQEINDKSEGRKEEQKRTNGEGKERKGKGREGKEKKGKVGDALLFSSSLYFYLPFSKILSFSFNFYFSFPLFFSIFLSCSTLFFSSSFTLYFSLFTFRHFLFLFLLHSSLLFPLNLYFLHLLCGKHITFTFT